MVARTLDFLKAHPDAPCFVNLWLDDPHTPWVPSADDQQLAKDGRAAGKGDTPARLAKVIIELDRQVGWRLDAVREMKSGRPTVVLFLSDNGPLPSFDRTRTFHLSIIPTSGFRDRLSTRRIVGIRPARYRASRASPGGRCPLVQIWCKRGAPDGA
jgi:arylsulfatase A-like enzyme